MKVLSVVGSTAYAQFRLADKTLRRIAEDTGMSIEELTSKPLQDIGACRQRKEFVNLFGLNIQPRNIYLRQGRILDLKHVKKYISRL